MILFSKQIFHAVSLSGGKDSTAMLLLMIERGMPIDIVLTADTGMEFPEMYDHLAKLDEYLYRERGIHLTMLRHPKGFEYMMFEEEKQKISSIENRQKLGVPLYGNGVTRMSKPSFFRSLKRILSARRSIGSRASIRLSTMSVSQQMSRNVSRTSSIRWWTGVSPKQRL